MKTTRLMVLTIVIAAGILSACTRAVVYKESSPKPVYKQKSPTPVIISEDGHGPPPHAPAHGYRAKHQGDDVVLVYDRHLAVYVVSGQRDCYYSAGQYFRFVDGSWEWSVSVSTGWAVVASYHDVPSSLCAKHGKGKHKVKHKKK